MKNEEYFVSVVAAPRPSRPAVTSPMQCGDFRKPASRWELFQILHEAGYQREEDSWRAPEFVALDRLTLRPD